VPPDRKAGNAIFGTPNLPIMELTLKPKIPALQHPIRYTDNILLLGSCFTEHMSGRLAAHKFHTLQNPHGILFNPASVACSLATYLEPEDYPEASLFNLHETWNSWDHHSRFSGMDKQEVLRRIHASNKEAHGFMKDAGWLIITLGSSFQYYLKDGNRPVANNHRAPAQWFEKKLLDTASIIDSLSSVLSKVFERNPSLRVLFTISPVRHIRDGVVENNRSKARLIEAVHTLCETFAQCHYFPAYELVIDILRDYRFYDIDFVHPNYLATEYVWEQFVKACIDPAAVPVMEQVKDLMTAKGHRPRFPGTEEHRKFRASYLAKARQLAATHPYLDLCDELGYFG
jgi:hypothetical protein